MSKKSITKDTLIREIVEEYPETVDVLTNYGMHCLSCAAQTNESLELACMMHDLDVLKVVDILNERVERDEI